MSDLITDFPALLNYWDFDKNIKIDVEKITVTSKKHINWKCPTCSYEWKASVTKSYKNIQNHSKICPVCELGEVFIKGENSLGRPPRDKLRQYSDTLRLHRAAIRIQTSFRKIPSFCFF